jgi:hypothetical protein
MAHLTFGKLAESASAPSTRRAIRLALRKALAIGGDAASRIA